MSTFSNYWALILGGSSGFGLATAKKLSSQGMNICIVHRDRRGAMERIEPEFEEIRKTGCGFLALNLDALSSEGRQETLDKLTAAMQPSGRIRLLLHSIAFGNLKLIAPYLPRSKETMALFNDSIQDVTYGAELIDDEDMSRTVYSMGTNMLTWVQEVFKRKLFADDARVLAMTSEGNEIAWRGYAAVSAAKAALEAVIRSIALEFAPYGIRANTIQAGVTDTPALKAIPGNQKMKMTAQMRNPFQRLTQPSDIANFIYLMCRDESAWVNGSILRVDGGESITSI